MEIEKLIPHRRKMVLIDRVAEMTPMSATTEVSISSQSLFAGPEGVPSYVGLEYLAQTIAVLGSQQSKGTEPRVGFLLGSRKYRSQLSHFPIGRKLTVKIELVEKNEDIGTYSGSIHLDDVRVAEGSLTILVRDSL